MFATHPASFIHHLPVVKCAVRFKDNNGLDLFNMKSDDLID